MFRTNYDSDITTWSPQGKLYQIEYAMKTVSQGSVCVGLKSQTHAVVVTLNRSAGDLATHQRKVFQIDSHFGVAIAGLTADARTLTRFMRERALNYRFVYDSPMPVGRMALAVADKAQKRTLFAGKRPFGLGVLMAGYDEMGPHIYETCPSGNYYDWKAHSIGARCQSARTYLEAHHEEYSIGDRNTLLCHALRALRDTLGTQDEDGLTATNVTLAIVGVDEPFHVLEEDVIGALIDSLPPLARLETVPDVEPTDDTTPA